LENSAGKEKQTMLMRAGIVAVVIVALLLALNLITGGRFATADNLVAIVSNSVFTAFLVLGMCFIFSMGITDLSMGAVVVLASNVGGILALHAGLGYFGMVIGAVAVAVACSLINVFLIRKAEIPAWILGLGMVMVYEAIGAIYNNAQIAQGKQSVSLGNSFRELGAPPWNIIILVVCVAIAYFVYNRTSIGFNLRAVGSNEAVAKLMGVNINKAVFLAVLVGGCFIGMGSAIDISYAGRITPSTGLNSIAMVFNPLAAYLLAQALSGVFNITIAAPIGALIITAVFNVLTIIGVPSGTWQQVMLGAVVLVCGMLSRRNYKGVVK
jgi:ribose transport system permease protein